MNSDICMCGHPRSAHGPDHFGRPEQTCYRPANERPCYCRENGGFRKRQNVRAGWCGITWVDHGAVR